MAKINEYPLERFTFGDDDYYDIDYWDGAVYQSAKIKGSTIKAAMSGGGSILAADGQVMPADRSQDLASFKLSLRDGVFTLGTVDADFGSIFQATKDSGNTYATIKTKTNDNAALILDINTADVTGAGNKTAFIQFRDAGVSKYIFGTNTDGVANFSDNSFFISSSAQLTDYIQAIDRDTESFVIGRQVGNPLNDNTKFLINNGNSFDTTELDNVLVLSSRDETKKWLVDKDMVMSHTKAQSLELTSTDNGVLLNRVTTAQMNAIASPTTNEIVYNTELNALYRYDGANWVALSAGYGLVSVNDSSGIPTFYANLKAAYDAATSGIVKLHSNITETSVNTITFKDGVYIDLNGYKYTYNVSDNSSAFNTSGSVTGFKFGLYNGEFSRLNQVGNQYAINIGNNAIVDLSNLNAVSSNNQCLSIGSDTKAFGSKFTSNISGIGNLITSNGILNGGTLINLGTGENRCQGVLNRVSCEAVSSNGIQLIGGKGYYLTCTSTSGDGLRATLGSEVYHSTGISSSGSGVVLGSNTIAEYCTGTSTSGVGFTAVSTSESYYCKGLSSTGIAFYVGAIAEFCTAITNSGTYAYLMDNLGSKLINCIGRVKTGTGSGVDINTANCEVIDCKMFLSSSLAYGLVPGARDTYVNGLKVKGSTLLFNWGGGASRNVWTATSDAQENSAQL